MKSRTKLAVLGVVIAAILYVLISPLPELDATHLLNFPVMSLVLLVVLLLMPPEPSRLPWLRRPAYVGEREVLLAETCVLLC